MPTALKTYPEEKVESKQEVFQADGPTRFPFLLVNPHAEKDSRLSVIILRFGRSIFSLQETEYNLLTPEIKNHSFKLPHKQQKCAGEDKRDKYDTFQKLVQHTDTYLILMST